MLYVRLPPLRTSTQRTKTIAVLTASLVAYLAIAAARAYRRPLPEVHERDGELVHRRIGPQP